MQRQSDVRQHYNWHRFPCRITSKSREAFGCALCSSAQRQPNKATLGQIKVSSSSLTLSYQTSTYRRKKCSPLSGQCPSYLSSASALHQLSPWQTSPLLWLLCLQSAATQAPCCGLVGPAGSRDEKKDKKWQIFSPESILFCRKCKIVMFAQIPWRFSSCPVCAFCPRLSLEQRQDCLSKPTSLLATSTDRNETN